MTQLSNNFGLLLVLSGLAFLFYRLCSPSKSLVKSLQPQEPTLISPRIPLIGHLIGVMRKGNTYYTSLSPRVRDLPIYSISLFFNFKAYVVTSAALVAAVHRHYKTLSFDPLMEQTAETMGAMSKDGLQKMKSGGIFESILKKMHPTMLPGLKMDVLSRITLARIEDAVNALAAQAVHSNSKPIDLYRWTRQTIGLASTHAVYGPHNPFQDAEFFDQFERLEQGVMQLFLNFYPRVFSQRAYQAREYCVKAYTKFLADGRLDYASPMLQAHDQTLLDGGLSVEDTARQSTGFGLAVVGNIIPTSFWLLYHIYEQPKLLDELRQEVEALVTREVDGKSGKICLNTANLQTAAPKLSSTFQEVLRYRSTSSSVRFVKEDTTISARKDSPSDEQYLLKKGNIIQLPAHLLHRQPDTWGEDAEDFRPDRFVDFLKGDAKIQAVSYRAFGGGDHICPGRFFSATEVLSFAASFIIKFDLVRVASLEHSTDEDSDSQKRHANGVWKEPALLGSAFSSSLLPPREAVPVKVSVRDGWQAPLKLQLGEKEGKFKLASG